MAIERDGEGQAFFDLSKGETQPKWGVVKCEFIREANGVGFRVGWSDRPTPQYPGWKFWVPRNFYDAIVEGGFRRGDTLYDSAAAHELPWSEALKKITHAVQVTFATPAKEFKGGDVRFILYSVNADRTALVAQPERRLTQIEFIGALQHGFGTAESS